MRTVIQLECSVCWNKQFKHKFYWKDYFYHTNDNKEYEIVECTRCKLEMINPMPSAEEQWSFYPSNYYSYSNISDIKNQQKKNIINRIWEKLQSLVDDKQLSLPLWDWKWKKFLDIGCGEWINLITMKNRWRDVNWFEIWDTWFENNIFYWNSIVDIDFQKTYDLIWCHHVFEHVCNPNEFLDKVYSLLNDDWIAIFCLPNVKWITSKIRWKYASERDIPRHLLWYNQSNMKKLLLKHKFKIKYENYLPNYWSFLSFSRYIYDKFNLIVKSKYIIRLFALFDIILSCLKPTNSMWFIFKK